MNLILEKHGGQYLINVELDSDISYNYLTNNFEQVQQYIPEIKYAKELISGINDDWNQLLLISLV